MVGVAGIHYSNPHWDCGSDSGSGSGRGRGQKWIACNKQTLIAVAVVVATANKQTNKQTLITVVRARAVTVGWRCG